MRQVRGHVERGARKISVLARAQDNEACPDLVSSRQNGLRHMSGVGLPDHPAGLDPGSAQVGYDLADGTPAWCSAVIAHGPGQPGQREFPDVQHDDAISVIPDLARCHVNRPADMLRRATRRDVDGQQDSRHGDLPAWLHFLLGSDHRMVPARAQQTGTLGPS